MDRDFLIDLFSDFGPVTIRRMFSGFGVSADGINFALALRGGIYLRADEHSIPRFEAEGTKPFQYQTRTRTVTVASYWQLPERLYDDPHELSEWARVAFAAAQRAALRKPPRKRKRTKVDKEPGKKAATRTTRKAVNKAKKSAVKKQPAETKPSKRKAWR
jgi:DNA transformation protein